MYHSAKPYVEDILVTSPCVSCVSLCDPNAVVGSDNASIEPLRPQSDPPFRWQALICQDLASSKWATIRQIILWSDHRYFHVLYRFTVTHEMAISISWDLTGTSCRPQASLSIYVLPPHLMMVTVMVMTMMTMVLVMDAFPYMCRLSIWF